MSNLRMFRNRSLFVKLLLSMTAIVVVTVILISSLTYTISANSSVQNSIAYNRSVLDQQRELINKELLEMQNIASSIMMTQSYLFHTINEKLSVGSLIDLTRILEEQRKLSPYIDSIYLVYGKLDLVLTSRSDMKMSRLSSFDDRSWLPEMERTAGSRTVWLTGRSDGLSSEDGALATSLMQKMPLIGPVEGAVVINMKLDALFSDFLSHYHNKRGSTVVLGPNDELLYGETDEAASLISQLDAAALSSDISDSYVDDRDRIITFTTTATTGWKFVNVTSKSVLLEGLGRIKTIVAAVAILYVAGAILLSFYISRRLYRPLKTVMAYIGGTPTVLDEPRAGESAQADDAEVSAADEASFIRQSFERLTSSRDAMRSEKDRVESLLRVNRSAIKEKYLSELIKGRVHGSDTGGQDEEAAGLLGLQLDFSRFAVLTFELEETPLLDESADKLHFHLFQYGLIEEFRGEIDGEIFARSDDRTVILLTVAEAQDGLPEEVAGKLLAHLQSRYGMTATIGLSRISSGVHALQSAYEESVEALNLKMYVGKGEIIPYAIVSSWKQDEERYYYPYELEGKLLQSLLQLDEDECADCIRRITQEVKDRRLSRANVQQLFFHLSGEIVKSLVQTGADMTAVLGDRPFALYGVKTLQEMERSLQELCGRIIAYQRDKRMRMNDVTLSLAIDFMDQHFNNNITVDTVAAHVQRSTSFLSRIFKEATGSTINDYLIHLRIKRACELLLQPKYTLEDICREIGYSNVSYFNKVFKSRTGFTPGQYRLQEGAKRQSGL
ncbi:AraC-like DNA-binding protein [Paenibacillus phyllosphaerae]|uniref:AraC-like DNA-binding protein n=1 Tax=Paenibacillus phyllosphaerae TaxID=274593 RepID=A0A7W5B314_9BACL|nr:helix-turn-helix domain-containing protein [Paenibacillus phyllosphaerae]MBB3113297.1 AraC-like DNA-binding protein [Paenibacillus phyllosphaerae]